MKTALPFLAILTFSASVFAAPSACDRGDKSLMKCKNMPGFPDAPHYPNTVELCKSKNGLYAIIGVTNDKPIREDVTESAGEQGHTQYTPKDVVNEITLSSAVEQGKLYTFLGKNDEQGEAHFMGVLICK